MEINEVLEKIAQSNGVITAKKLNSFGVSPALIAYLSSQGRLIRIERGVYSLPDIPVDCFFSSQARYAKGVFSHNTALYLHGLSDRTPYELEMTFPRSYNITKCKENGIRPYRTTEQNYLSDVMEVKTPSNNTVCAYSAERTICDVFRYSKGAPSDEEINAIKRYLKKSERDLNRLISIAKKQKTDKIIRHFLEALV